jgi:hypothetical protein
MRATRRKVLSWLLAAVIVPPRLELPVEPEVDPVTMAVELLGLRLDPWQQQLLTQLRHWTLEQVAEVYSVPRHLIGGKPWVT